MSYFQRTQPLIVRSIATILAVCLSALNPTPFACAQALPQTKPPSAAASPAPVSSPIAMASGFPVAVETPSSEEVDKRPVLAIAAIESTAQETGLRSTVADQLAVSLLNIEDFKAQFRLVERSRVEEVVKELVMQGYTGMTDAKTQKQLGKILNTSFLLLGSIRQEKEERLTLNLTLVNTQTAEVKEGVTVANIPRTDLNEGIECLALNISSKLKVGVSKERLAELNNKFKPQWAGGSFLLWAILGVVAIGGGIGVLLATQKANPTNLRISW